jgi:curved DNA-binding protein CbpA
MTSTAAPVRHHGGVTTTETLSLYEVLAVPPSCSPDELRRAYRRRARELHPDVAAGADTGRAMAELNAAWRVLSDPSARRRYDQTLAHRSPVPPTPQPGPQASTSRRRAWVAGVQAQIVHLARLAGHAAAQGQLLRHPRGTRAEYDALVEAMVRALLEDTEARLRAARAAGAAPLDLGVATVLVGLRTLADRLRRQATLGITNEILMTAELVDRMWDILAHELPSSFTAGLGGNPHLARRLGARR